MNATLPPPTFEPLDPDEYKRQATLLKALNCAHPVLFEGKERHIHVLHARLSGGRVEMDVWLTGSPDRIAPELITLPKKE